MKLAKVQAYRLLIEGLEKPETIGYVPHCRYVGNSIYDLYQKLK